MAVNTTTCPNCGTKFDADEALQKHLEIELQKQIKLQEEANNKKLNEIKLQMQQEKVKFEQEEKKKMWAVAQAEAQKRSDAKSSALLKSLQEENTEKQKQLLDAQKKEIELMKKERELNNKQESMKIEYEKIMLQRSKEIEEDAKKKKDQEFELVKKEYEKQLENQMNLVNEMKRKAEQGSMQLQGEIQELVLEEILRRSYLFDKIEEIGKGMRGADVIQTVVNEFGQECGRIIFESKRTQNFANEWIEKLKTDQRNIGADLAVIVTQAMPKDMDRFGQKDGVWICTFHEMNSLVFILRKILLSTQNAKSVQENKADKMSILYNYLTGSQFKQQLEAIVDGFTTLKNELDKEKRAMHRIWKEREMQIEKVIGNTIDMYGSVKGIAGNAVESIKYLELGDDEDEI